MHWTESIPVSSNLPWYVVRVRANAEWKVAESLSNRGIETLLPVRKRFSRQKKRGLVEIPLFPGYVFVRFDYRAVLTVVTCPGIVHILSRGNRPEPVDAGEMHALQSVSRIARSVEPFSAFTAGQNVKINTGPLADVEGLVVRDNGRPRLVISISLLQRSVVAEVDREWLEDFNTPMSASHWAQVEG